MAADTIRQQLEAVLSLQPKWTKGSSPEMNERGELVKRHLPVALSTLIQESNPPIIGLNAEGGDGLGMKARVPWVRIYSPIHSASPMHGYYVVYLFVSDGSSVFLSLNQGAFERVGRRVKQKPREEISRKVTEARKQISSADIDTLGLLEEINLKDLNAGKAYGHSNIFSIEYPRPSSS